MQKWKVYLTFESEGNILIESKLYILEENEMKNRLEEIRKERGMERDSRQTDYIRHFISCGAMGMVKRWLAEGMPLSKAEMMDLTEKIMHPIFQLLFVA